jgi:biopolymer transport protein TolQ
MEFVAMNTTFSMFDLILHASWVVQLVVAALLVVSVASWSSIFSKRRALKKMNLLNDAFEGEFWGGGNLNDLYTASATAPQNVGALQRIFANGMREHQKLRQLQPNGTTGNISGSTSAAADAAAASTAHQIMGSPSLAGSIYNDHTAVLEGTRRAMRASYQREMDSIESQLSFLASVGSVSPYVGLFGTVWGIMHAFTGLSSLQQVTLATVAPGIAEALIATAVGLFAAIPAVLAYNHFARDIDRLAVRLETFIDEFSNILQRKLSSSPSGAKAPAH